ncbi:MAG TPA: sigma-70 family RNA polymerase sigma factor [Lacisediminihabitans sp.]|uniref:RNA polymerase sigma factor n=1 Tax=Lacisediminihabitans sp. TaxID=2787631 RepID=UPI002ED905FE
MKTEGGDKARFAAFYRKHYSVVLATCHRRLGNRLDAEDAAAEVSRVVWQRYSREDPPLPTLYTIVRNVIGNEYRRARRAQATEYRLQQAALTTAPDYDPIELRDALLHLRPEDRELLYLTYWEHLTAREIATIIRSSPGAVWVRLTRVREALREILGGFGPPPASATAGDLNAR